MSKFVNILLQINTMSGWLYVYVYEYESKGGMNLQGEPEILSIKFYKKLTVIFFFCKILENILLKFGISIQRDPHLTKHDSVYVCKKTSKLPPLLYYEYQTLDTHTQHQLSCQMPNICLFAQKRI